MSPPRDTAAVRAHWNRLARTYDRREALIERLIAPLRKRVWARTHGRILEVGAGTGKNFPFHPLETEIIATDLSSGMLVYARARAQALGRVVDVREGDAEALPFPAASFDTAVATDDPAAGACPDRPSTRRTRDGPYRSLLLRINGSHLNRRTVENVRHAGLRITQMEEFGPMGVVRLIEAGLDGARS